MPSATSYDAVEAFCAPIQEALSCLTNKRLFYGGGYYLRPEPHVLLIEDGAPTRIARNPRVSLKFYMRYRIVEESFPSDPWTVRISEYAYGLLGDNAEEIFVYHWHPESRISPVPFPHLHLKAGANVGLVALHAAHLPTGWVTVQDLLRVASERFGARPRGDWETILARTRIQSLHYFPVPALEAR